MNTVDKVLDAFLETTGFGATLVARNPMSSMTFPIYSNKKTMTGRTIRTPVVKNYCVKCGKVLPLRKFNTCCGIIYRMFYAGYLYGNNYDWDTNYYEPYTAEAAKFLYINTNKDRIFTPTGTYVEIPTGFDYAISKYELMKI